MNANSESTSGSAAVPADVRHEFWRRQLSAAAVSSLPSFRPRPALLGERYAAVFVDWNAQTQSQCLAQAHALSVRPHLLLCAALSAFVARYSGQADNCVGVTLQAARTMCGDGNGGADADILPIRQTIALDSPLAGAVAGTGQSLQNALNNAIPLRDIFSHGGTQRSSSHAAFVQVVVGLARAHAVDRAEAEVARICPVVAQATGSVPDLAVLLPDAGTAGLCIAYNSALFERAHIERYAAHFSEFLRSFLAEPATPIDQLRLLSATERERLLATTSDAATPAAPGPTLHEWFEVQAHKTPNAVALKFGDRALTYAELNTRANQLAHYLRARGAAPEQLIGLCLERSLELVIGILGILKSGAAYLPLDLVYPKERLAAIVEDAGVSIILSLAANRAQLPAGDAQVICLDNDWSTIEQSPVANPAPVATADNLAYVIYTSGSTGKPKGCQITHANAVRLFTSTDAWFGFAASDVWTLFHSHAFDFSVWEIWGALLYGGCVVVVPLEIARSPDAFRRLLSRERVSVLSQTPSAFRALIDADLNLTESLPLNLRYVVFGGEALELQMLRPWIDRHGDIAPQLINMYGITETTVHVTYRPITRADLDGGAGSVIGQAIPDLRVYVLDAHGEPVPSGVAGEMYVGGAGVARGYLNRPELTAQRFVQWPAGTNAQGEVPRLYRTGDLARRLPDGSLEYLGRIDHQVKIRGFRIETGEIEATLMQTPGVRACAVIARDDGVGEKRLVAYIVAADEKLQISTLRARLATTLPEYMIPSAFVRIDHLPQTENGKLDRQALPAPGRARPELPNAFAPAACASEVRVCEAFAAVLDLDQVGRLDNFFALGGTSLLAVRSVAQLNRGNAVELSIPAFFADPTPAAMAAALDGKQSTKIGAERVARRGGDSNHEPVAIIAMAGRFPGANDVEEFWRNLCAGRESITFFGENDLDPSIAAAERMDPAYVRARGVIDGIENFDAAFFGITPREAELTDPQQRIFLELCWECLERGGYVPDTHRSPVGVFGGMFNASYFQNHISRRPDLIEKLGTFQVMLGNEKDYITTRVAHRLNLTGPAISVHTACSTSLVAICQAFNALRAGQCDMALAGGASVTCPPRSGYLHQEGAMLSPDGHTRSFAAAAQGTVFSDGAAVVLLKRLSDAIADGDLIYAVIRGAAVNNDGAIKASFTAPSSEGQAAVIAMALDSAGVDARSISYVEAHGTATPLGDPIEVEGLTKAFRLSTDDVGFCRIGSVKSNVGHLVTAAGAAGVIKTALALTERRLPPSLHVQSINPAIDFANSPFVVNDRLQAWTVASGPLRAGVSSFGVGGTNAHVILEEPPQREPSDAVSGPQLLLLSARTTEQLQSARLRLGTQLNATPDLNLADVAYTLAQGRKAFVHRAYVVAESIEQAAAALQAPSAAASSAQTHVADIVFMFPGQGAQYAGMGRALYAAEPLFRAALDECAQLAQADLGFDLRDRMFSQDAEALRETSLTQPATFAIEYALARLWIGVGIHPTVLVGHSVGEFVAAVLAGVMSLRDGIGLVARRGRLMQQQPAGAMLSVRLSAEQIIARLPSELALAAENAPRACVVAGAIEAVERFGASLESEGIACRMLQTSHAFHSAMMDPVLDPFRAEVAKLALNAPAIPIISTASGERLSDDQARSVDYWTGHLRSTVRFSAALAQVLDAPHRILLEIGPRNTLAALARQQPRIGAALVISSLADAPASERATWLAAAGQLWSAGAALDLDKLDQRELRRRVRLPTYPFERRRCWVEASPAAAQAAPAIAPMIAPFGASATNTPTIVTPVTPMNPNSPVASPAPVDRRPRLIAQLKELFEDVAGVDLADADPLSNFLEYGLDSLTLTQVALQIQKTFALKVTFRQLMDTLASFDRLAAYLDTELPVDAVPVPSAPTQGAQGSSAVGAATTLASMQLPADGSMGGLMQQVIQQQMLVMQQQLAMLSAAAGANASAPAAQIAPPVPAVPSTPTSSPDPTRAANAPSLAGAGGDEEAALAHTTYDVKKAFGAIARIHSTNTELSERQRMRLDLFMRRYMARTPRSKAYTQQHRAHLADPRVVNGFRPLLKEIVYQIVVDKSKGSRMWDLDGNEYIDALNGFGMNLFGWQPDFVLDAVRRQLDLGYEIGPQHPLAGEVAQLVCELTGFDRAGLCNTGSEAVMGTIRIARTVTGRNTLVVFAGSYHGIFDEVLVRGTKKLRAVPAAPGILRNTAEHVLVLDYGTPETLAIIRERAHEIAAVLVEPVQSRRPDFQPREFLQEVRKITRDAGAVLIFDEVVTGFRAHMRGAQQLLGIDADLASYGKVVGGGFPIGVIAGKREFMDALDGGQWQFGDDSTPTVGVTYFAGTFVRHPLALAAAKAVLEHLKAGGAELQERLNARTAAMAAQLNAFCTEVGAPIEIKHFASVWKLNFVEDHPLQDLFFAMMRSRGIHMLENFPHFFTTAHSEADFMAITKAFKESVLELQEAEFLPRRKNVSSIVLDASKPPVPGARLGKDPDGKPAWFVPHPDTPGKFLKVTA